jgi:hypothetical protein
MYTFRSLERSEIPTKKWRVNFTNSKTGKIKTVNFGATGYRDYTTIDNKEEAIKARTAYRNRHAKDNLSDPTSPGALSYYILWGDYDNTNQNLSAYRRRFGI